VLAQEEHRGRLAFFAGVDGVRFRRPVRPGDTLILDVEIIRARGTVGKGRGVATVDGAVVAEGELMFAVQPRP